MQETPQVSKFFNIFAAEMKKQVIKITFIINTKTGILHSFFSCGIEFLKIYRYDNRRDYNKEAATTPRNDQGFVGC